MFVFSPESLRENFATINLQQIGGTKPVQYTRYMDKYIVHCKYSSYIQSFSHLHMKEFYC